MSTQPEIREAVKIVVERMQTHPEEFASPGRFCWLKNLSLHELGLTETEMDAITEARCKMQYRGFHNAVLEALLEDPTSRALKVQGSSLKP